MLVALPLVLGTTGLQSWRSYRLAEQRIEQHLATAASVLAEQLPESVYQIQHRTVRDSLQAALAWGGIAHLEVLEGGQLIAEAGDASVREQVEAQSIPILRPRRLSAAGLDRPLGELRLRVDRRLIWREAREAAVSTALAGLLVGSVLVGLVWVQTRRLVQRPLRQLALGLDAMEASAAPLPWKRSQGATEDELDRAVAALNRLQARVSEQVRQLDSQVTARTAELQQALSQLRQQSMTDALTGCVNRLGFAPRLEDELHRSERYDHPLSLVFCDVDHFKAVNDRHGHAIGDQVLAAVGSSLRELVRTGADWVARYGGEEFVIVLPETACGEARELAERLRASLADTLWLPLPDGGTLRISASFGVAEREAGESASSLLQRADQALYRAKHEGRNRVEVASAEQGFSRVAVEGAGAVQPA